MHVAKVLRLLEAQQALDLANIRQVGESKRGGELLSLFHDAIREAHDRDYRSPCIFFANVFDTENVRVRVVDINHMTSKELRLRRNVFHMEGFLDHDG